MSETVSDKLRILVADDHNIVRQGLAALINAQTDMTVVAEASGGKEAMERACELKPDIAVLDVSMPDIGGAEAAERIRRECPDVRVIALTRHTDQAYVRRLLRAGANGYVLKKSAAEALINAIRVVAKGGTYVEPELAGAVFERAFSPTHGGAANPADQLSGREEQVLRSLAWGRSSKEIAGELGISVKTVESYKSTATEKLSLRSREDIVRYALARGWLSDDTSPE
jgi:DNA-binding NarL/FixJ family response regulator